MEKRNQKSQIQSDQQPNSEGHKNYGRDKPTNHLFQLLPKCLRQRYEGNTNIDLCLYDCLSNLHLHSRIQQLKDLFDQIGADVNTWAGLSTSSQKSEYLLHALQKNVEQSIKKVNQQTNAYLNSINVVKHSDNQSWNSSTKNKGNDFDWLQLNTNNQMLKSKLKTKLVQTINQFKNEKRLREVMDRQLEDHQKIYLEDQSIDLFQDEKSKLNYEWTIQDEQMFLSNIQKLKQKFTKTEFLKNCHRYKFITNSEMKTLACEQISRKLDKSNKAFLSRQFLLDKYFSTKQNLTQKQMKFILKTSPLLSKCVDKAFVRAAIKNIQYQDIDKMELQIAEQIIQKFETIRNLVKSSRKLYKQRQNNRAKNKIKIFQKCKREQQVRRSMEEKIQIHKVKMIRNLNYKPNASKSTNLSKRKQNHDSIFQLNFTQPQKIAWPIPLNNHHPSTGLFIKDCSEQLNDQFNEYEKNYIKNVFKNQDSNHAVKKNHETQSAMIKFYTGGPLDCSYSSKNMPLTSTNAFSQLRKSNHNFDENVIQTVCQAFKIAEFKKQINAKLNTIQIDEEQQQQQLFDDKKTINPSKSISDFNQIQTTKRTKKSEKLELQSNISNKVQNCTEKVIKDRIIEGKQKAKMNLFVKKLHSLAAQNSFLSLKALNVKFSAAQVNSLDSKGNTALYYATKNKNSDFIDYLLSMKADVNIKCSKGATPLHNAFRSSNYSLICKCISGPVAPNLNMLDDENKTPLAYCCRKVLEMLGLQNGIVCVKPGQKMKFNNNSLLQNSTDQNNVIDQLQMKLQIRRKNPSKENTATCI